MIIRRARTVWRRLRPRLAVLRMKAVTTVYRRMVLLTYPLQAGPIPDLSPRVPVVFGLLKDADLEAYLTLRPRQPRAELHARLARGDRCFVGRHDGRIVDTGWVATTPRPYVGYLNAELELQPGDAYNYDAYTALELRGRGLYMSRNSFIAHHLQREGWQRSVALVAAENRHALAVLRRSGLSEIGVYTYIRGGLWEWRWQQPYGDEPLLPLRAGIRGATT